VRRLLVTAARVISRLADVAGIAAILTYCVADAFAAIDRTLSSYDVEVPDEIPYWVDEEVDE
jgi:hypothetical protein